MKISFHPYLISTLYLILLFTMHAFATTDAAAKGIFKCVKPNGEIEYTQSPSADCKVKKLKNTGGHADQKAIKKQQQDKEDRQIVDQKRKSDDQKSLDQKIATQEKQDYCDSVKNNLGQMLTSPRLFKTDAQGNRINLTEEDRQQRIKESQDNLKEHCQ